jgi:hypothetical protein
MKRNFSGTHALPRYGIDLVYGSVARRVLLELVFLRRAFDGGSRVERFAICD